MSQANARLAPAPAATPCTAQTTGFGMVRMARMIGRVAGLEQVAEIGALRHVGQVLPGAEAAALAAEQDRAAARVAGRGVRVRPAAPIAAARRTRSAGPAGSGSACARRRSARPAARRSRCPPRSPQTMRDGEELSSAALFAGLLDRLAEPAAEEGGQRDLLRGEARGRAGPAVRRRAASAPRRGCRPGSPRTRLGGCSTCGRSPACCRAAWRRSRPP